MYFPLFHNPIFYLRTIIIGILLFCEQSRACYGGMVTCTILWGYTDEYNMLPACERLTASSGKQTHKSVVTVQEDEYFHRG